MPGKKDQLPIMPEGTDPATLLKAWGAGKKQKEIADQLCISVETYKKWAEGTANIPHQRLPDIVRVFRLNEAQTTQLYEAMQRIAPRKNNLPLQNRFFTGRESYIERLDQCFKEDNCVAISGLGGIGKTQLALEYAHRRYKKKIYRAVLWVNAADQTTIESGYRSLAEELDLLERDGREIERIIRAVKRWFAEHTHWLLIIDNADDLHLTRSFFPVTDQGCILLTTRSQIGDTTIASQIELTEMTPEEGLSFLLKRSRKTLSDGDTQKAAQQLVELLGGHPLALDQAGAYIEGNPTRTFAEYIDLYYTERRRLLDRLGRRTSDHPESVLVTFELCFQKARELHSLAEDILHFCAFLYPDAISEKLFQHEDYFKDTIAFDEGIEALRRYSLIQSDAPQKRFSLHRLVQDTIIELMSEETKKEWRGKVVKMLSKEFADAQWFREYTRMMREQLRFHREYVRSKDNSKSREFTFMFNCDELLPHAVECLFWKDDDLVCIREISLLFTAVGLHLICNRLKVREAEPFLVRALAVRKRYMGEDHPLTALSARLLACVYWLQERFEEAEPLFEQALSVYEQWWEARHIHEVMYIYQLTHTYCIQKKYDKAASLWQRMLAQLEEELGKDHILIARMLIEVGRVYEAIPGKLDEAASAHLRAIDILDQNPPEKLFLLSSMNNIQSLVCIYLIQGKYAEAEAQATRLIDVSQKFFETEHTGDLAWLLLVYRVSGQHEQAEALHSRIMAHIPDFHELAPRSEEELRERELLFLRDFGRQEEGVNLYYEDTPVIRAGFEHFIRVTKREMEAEIWRAPDEWLTEWVKNVSR